MSIYRTLAIQINSCIITYRAVKTDNFEVIYLKDLSPIKIVSLIKKKQISIAEVLESFYQRIEDYNGMLKAIVSLKDREQVFSEVDEFSRQGRNHESQLLYGLPLAIKDLVDVSGLPTTYGIPRYYNNIPKTLE